MLKILITMLFASLSVASGAAPQLAQEIDKHARPGNERTAPAQALALVNAARSQIGVTLTYDPAYERLAYPNGDVPIERGVCTDVVIRAYRK